MAAGGFNPGMLSQPAGAAQVAQGGSIYTGGFNPWGGGGFLPPYYTPVQPPPPQTPAPQQQTPSTPPGYSQASNATRMDFMPQSLFAPFYNMAGVAGNLGTMMGAVAPSAAHFMGSMFSPNLTGMEQSFMQAGLGNALTGLEQGMIRQEGQFEGTPFHSALPRAQGEVMEQFGRDAMQSAAGMGLQRQQTAAGMSQFPFQFPLQASQAPVAAAEAMFNMANQAFMAPYQLPMSFYQQYPVVMPTVLATPTRTA